MTLPEAGRYEVRLAYTTNPNRATNVPVIVHHREGREMKRVNQRIAPPIDKRFVSLGSFEFAGGQQTIVTVETTDTDGHVVVDAVQLLKP